MLEKLGFRLAPIALAALALSCTCEDYYCDDEACYYCDGVGCREVEPPTWPTCRGDFECQSGSMCTDQGCVATCDSDDDCPDGTTCRESTGMCVAPGGTDPTPNPGTCARNADCGDAGLVCRDGQCQPDDQSCGEAGCSCVDTGACSEGFVCSGGECRADDSVCRFNHQCGEEGRVCVDGRCIDECDAERPCPTGSTCEGGLCRETPAPGACGANADCGEGKVCLDAVCYDGCATDPECGDGRYCDTGICRIDDRPRPFCATDADCQPGHPCRDGVCRTPCGDHAECLMFDVQFNFCLDGLCSTEREATTNCATSTDCDAGEVCRDGICR